MSPQHATKTFTTPPASFKQTYTTHINRYLPHVDGLRALAVLAVILCHAKFSMFSGGFVGVDIFFVISGYVVARSILHDQEAGVFSLKRFYTRRLARLAPALYLVMAVTFGFGVLYCLPSNNMELAKNIGYVSIFLSNIYLSKQTGYFDLAADQHPLLHTWSLSVEEQIYLIAPLAFVLLAKRRLYIKQTVAIAVTVLLTLASCWLVSRGKAGAYYFLQGRAFEFTLGIVLALFATQGKLQFTWWVGELLSLLGLGIVAWCVITYRASTAMPGGNAIWPCVGAVLILLGALRARYVSRLFTNRGATQLGKLSYSLYLWHFPVLFAFGRFQLTGAWNMALAMVCALLLTIPTYLYVEQPLRRQQWTFKRAILQLWLVPVMLSILLIVVGTLTNQFTLFTGARYQRDFRESGQTVFSDSRGKKCWGKVDVTAASDCSVGDVSATTKGVFWGDSHAYHLIDFIDAIGKRKNVAIHDVAFTMCAPVENSPERAGDGAFQRHAEECRAHDKAVMNYILATPDIKFVFMSAVWDLYADVDNTPEPNLHGYVAGEIDKELAATIGKLEAAGKRVILLDDIPVAPAEMENCVANRLYLPGHAADLCVYPRKYADDRYVEPRNILNRITTRFPQVAVLHTYEVPCDDKVCRMELLGTSLYAHNDRGHLGAGGSRIYFEAYLQKHPQELDEAWRQLSQGLVLSR
ncbi:acyltransferase family protein [Massilia horti]|nr:acyltransferase family protein [Massilia horti]